MTKALSIGAYGMGRVHAISKKFSPVGLIGVSLFLFVYGATVAGVIAFAATLAIIALAHKPRGRMAQQAGVVSFALAALVGLPAALYNFSTEQCIGVALDLSGGDVASMSDPRLSSQDRIWVEKAYRTVAPAWQQAGLPRLRPEAIANVLVNAPAYVRAMVARDGAPARPAVIRAKEALVAALFDRRSVCHAFGAGPLLAFDGLRAQREATILGTADTALAALAPALQVSFTPSPELADAAQSPIVATADRPFED